ncbi:MAG: hypothetical protein IJ842_00640 [Bacilli bacterium]|nr:hypothetical protein [Bacilli bacterium]
MIPIVILIISLLLDGLLTNYLPFLINDLSLLTPLLTVSSIIIIYPFYRKKENKYYLLLFIFGMIYDLFYTNLLFFNGILFVIIGIISKYIYKNYGLSLVKIILYIILIISIYESLTGIILFSFNIVSITFNRVFYKITHSLLTNIIYIELVYLIIKIIPKKYKKISIN